MTSHRTILSILTLLAVLPAAMPSSAQAGSLLSGYGGPGAGSQEILGSTLIGGGGSSGSSGSTGSGGSSLGAVTGAGSSATTTASGSGGHSSPARGHGGRVAGGSSSRAGGDVGGASDRAANAYVSSSEGQISRSAFLYILLVLGALVCTGLFTRRLTRTPPGREARHG
jgi:hypothetical protein